MTLYRVCCCEPVVTQPCDTSCDFASSYVATNLSGYFEYRRVKTLTPLCGNCLGSTGPRSNYEIVISYAPLGGPNVVTRYGPAGDCCYRCDLEMRVTYSITIAQWVQYENGFGPPNVCESNQTFTGTVDVPACLTIQCVAAAYEGCDGGWVGTTPGQWLHSLWICDFPVVPSWEALGGDCEYPIQAECVSFPPQAFICGGAVHTWVSDLMALQNINTDGSTINGWDAIACNQAEWPNAGFGCFQWVAVHQLQSGPFALYLAEEYGESDPYEVCSDVYLGEAYFKTIPPDGYNCWNVDIQTPCSELFMTWNHSIPDYT